jgi:sulfhydrogenase subunit beta (sulfur reductase)
MKAFRLERTQLLVAHLAASREVYAPVGDLVESHWLRIDAQDAAAEIEPERRPLFSPKQFFFAERERLFRFEQGRFVEALPVVAPRALFGVHACDLAAIAYQDRFFEDDAHYRARRAATLLVGLDCRSACADGFCHVVDAGPAVRDGHADLVLQRSADAGPWLLIAESEAGLAALEGMELEPADESWPAQRARAEQEVVAEFRDASHVVQGMARLHAGEVTADTWEQLGLRCVACSGCTTVCPTCSCFAPRASTDAAGVEHERVWDSCLLEGFQREASGAHPSASPGMRVERYWFHKFGEPFRERFGRHTCVGCGRCESACPGVIGVHSTLRRIASA